MSGDGRSTEREWKTQWQMGRLGRALIRWQEAPGEPWRRNIIRFELSADPYPTQHCHLHLRHHHSLNNRCTIPGTITPLILPAPWPQTIRSARVILRVSSLYSVHRSIPPYPSNPHLTSPTERQPRHDGLGRRPRRRRSSRRCRLRRRRCIRRFPGVLRKPGVSAKATKSEGADFVELKWMSRSGWSMKEVKYTVMLNELRGRVPARCCIVRRLGCLYAKAVSRQI